MEFREGQSGARATAAAAASVLNAFRSEHFSVSLLEYRASLRQSWHRHEETILTLMLAGYAREQVGRADVVAGPLDVGLKPCGLRHTDHFWPNRVRALRILLSTSLVAESLGDSRALERWDWMAGSRAVGSLLRVAASLLHDRPQDEDVAQGVYEALAALTRRTPDRPAAAAPAWLRRAREHLETSYASGARLTHLAREAGVHPVYFARQFRRFYGCSVGEYIRRLQLRAVADLLAGRRAGLAQIAHQVGCSDQSHLNKILTNEYGLTPGQLRRLLTTAKQRRSQ